MSEEHVKVSVDAEALRQVLEALHGPDYMIRELQCTTGPLFPNNPIEVLTASYSEAIKE